MPRTDRILLAAGLALLASGCAHHAAPTPPPTAVSELSFGCPSGGVAAATREDLLASKLEAPSRVAGVRITELRCARAADLWRVEAVVLNGTGDTRRVAWRMRWLDAQGMQVQAADEGWKPVLLYPNGQQVLQASAPSGAAADFRISLMPQDQ